MIRRLLPLLCLLASCTGPVAGDGDAAQPADLVPDGQQPLDVPAELGADLEGDLAGEVLPLPALEGLGPWQRVDFIPGGLAARSLRALAAEGERAVAVGDGGLVLYRSASGRFVPLASTGEQLHGALFRDDGSAVICGEAGALLLLDDDGLRDFSPRPPADFHCLALAGQGQRFYLAGRGGRLLFFDGQAFVAQQTFLGADLGSLALRSQVEVLVGSAQGSVLRLEGEAWLNNQIFGSSSAVHALAFASDGRVFAGGGGGEVAILDEGVWRAAASNDPLGRALRAVAPELPIFVGDGGVLLRPQGANWVMDASDLPLGLKADLLALQPLEDGSLLLAGAGGTLLQRLPGQAFKPLPLLPDLEVLAASEDGVGGLWTGGRDFLYHSVDGQHWVGVPLPGPALIRALLPLEGGGILAASAEGRLLECEVPGRAPLLRHLDGAPELLALCALEDQVLLAGDDGYLGLLGQEAQPRRLESGVADALGTCVSLPGLVLVPGGAGRVLGVDALGNLAPESLPWPVRVRGLLTAPGGTVLALAEDGAVARRSAAGTWTALFPGWPGLDFLALDDGGLLLALGTPAAGSGQLALMSLDQQGRPLAASPLPEKFPATFLTRWGASWLLGGVGGRLYRAGLSD